MNENTQAPAAGDPEIHHDPVGHRFSTTVDGQTGQVDYRSDGGVMTITHTLVPPPIRGRGIAGRLVATALDHARGEGLSVVPSCSYAAAYIDKHPGYADLLA